MGLHWVPLIWYVHSYLILGQRLRPGLRQQGALSKWTSLALQREKFSCDLDFPLTVGALSTGGL